MRKWLSYELWKAHENAPSGSALDDALRVLEAKALFESPRHELSVRVARDDQGALWYDLGEARDRAVCITSEGWEIVENPPPLFRRWALSDPQVEPVKGTSFAGLKDLLNLKDPQGHGFNLILAWLVACLFPEIAHPVLVIHGEQGSAKSTMAKLLVSLIDPSKTPLRSEPRNRPEWAQAADHCWMIAIDNLSRLPGWMSDAFCRAATGDADSKRALYTNSDDIILRFRRALVLTGISVVATRQDLLDRSILLPLEPISAEKRMSEEEVIANFEQVKPALLGRLFDLAVEVLRLLPDSPKRNLPRMADFAKIGIAVERACGWSEGTFMEAYNANLREVTREALSASPVASAVILWMKDRTEWSGTWQQLLKALNLFVGEEQTKSTEWPRSARALSAELKRAAPNLRTASIEQNEGRHSREGTRLTLINRRDTSSPSSPSSLFDDSEGDGSDAGDDGD